MGSDALTPLTPSHLAEPCLEPAGHGVGRGQDAFSGEAGDDAQRQIAAAELWRQSREAAHYAPAAERPAGAVHVFQRMLLMGRIVVGQLLVRVDIAEGDHGEAVGAHPQPAIRLAAMIGEIVRPAIGWNEQVGPYLE